VVPLILLVLVRQFVVIRWWSVFLEWELLVAASVTIGVMVAAYTQYRSVRRLKSGVNERWLRKWLTFHDSSVANPDQLFQNLKYDFSAMEREWIRSWQMLAIYLLPVSLCGFVYLFRNINNIHLEQVSIQMRLGTVLAPVAVFLAGIIGLLLWSRSTRSQIDTCITQADRVINDLFDTGVLADLATLPAIHVLPPQGIELVDDVEIQTDQMRSTVGSSTSHSARPPGLPSVGASKRVPSTTGGGGLPNRRKAERTE